MIIEYYELVMEFLNLIINVLIVYLLIRILTEMEN